MKKILESTFAQIILLFTGLAQGRRISKTNCSSTATFYRVGGPNTALTLTSIADHTATSLEHCIDLCVDTEQCHAFNIRKNSAEDYDCQLKPGDHITNPESVASLTGFSLYDTGSQDLSSQVVYFFINSSRFVYFNILVVY